MLYYYETAICICIIAHTYKTSSIIIYTRERDAYRVDACCTYTTQCAILLARVTPAELLLRTVCVCAGVWRAYDMYMHGAACCCMCMISQCFDRY